MDARCSGVTFAVSEGNSARISSKGTTRVVGVGAVCGAHAAQDDGTVAVAGGVEPIRDPGILGTQHHAHHPVGIHHGLMGVQARLVAPVMDGLPPRVADGKAPVDTFRRFHFDDERLAGAQLPPADDRPVLRGRSDIGAVDRRQEAVRWRRRTELQEEREVVLDEIAEGDQLPRHRHVRIDRTACGVHRVTEPLNAQRRRHFGVPVVEEVPDRQRGVVALNTHPISGSLIGRQNHVEVPVGIHLEFVDQLVRSCRDAVHRLQPDVAGGAAIAEQSVALPAAQHGTRVDAVRTLHSPGHDVVGTGALDRQDRIRIEPQYFIDAGGKQHEKMSHTRGEIDSILARGIGFHDPGGFAEPVQEVRPRLCQVDVAEVPGLAPPQRSRTATTPAASSGRSRFPTSACATGS